ncbi:hypothetical protein HDV02_005354 [Globomyces sp. JEL0801]|nr:hypothetical protein HDV02_005354 [Globomyces sp. JEL0801]
MLEPFFLSLFIFMSLNVGLIPLYIVKFEGSIENVNWAALVMMAFFPACIAFLGLASANIRFYIELIIMPFLRLLSISIMFLSCTWTWYTLKVQQLDREDHLSRRTFLTNEIYKHQASLIMMRLSGSLALISTLLLVSQLSFGLSLIFTDSLAKSFEEFPQFLRVLYVMNQLITCSNAGILAVGIYLSTRKPKSIHNSQQVPAHAILRNPNQVNPVAKTVRFDLADTVRESSESADPNSDIMDHIAVNGVDRTISTIRVSGSTSIDTTGTSVYTDDLEVQDTGVVQNYLQHYVIQPVVFIQFCIVAYWAQLITKFNRTP